MSIGLYTKYHVERHDERAQLFDLIVEQFGVRSGIYPGCFVHVTPSFFIPRMVYVDTEKRAERFFAQGEALALVNERKSYRDEPEITFHRQDYTQPLPIPEETVDLLISQYAGFVSERCKRYLRRGGILLANNSHGDAGLAACDPDFALIAVVQRRGESFRMVTSSLSDYFVPKSAQVPHGEAELRAYIKQLGRGVGYTKTAAAYLFRKT